MENPGSKKIKIGICVMEKKVFAMEEILKRLESFGEFEIIHFGDKVILEDPIDCWPACDCLIAFHSAGFPLEKAEEYAKLRRPFLINELNPQHDLQDRRKVYELLEQYKIPIPRYAVVSREVPHEELDYFFEGEDFIEIRGSRFWKPFVEKPVHGDDHRIMIYYPSSAGGGMKELFRKVGNKSSQFHPEVKRVRRDGSYIYEEFIMTEGTDVKVYTVGPEYTHAEARKSPVVDGVVMRNENGKEVRYPVLLTETEKEIARNIFLAFEQKVCGFDLLRCGEHSYVCDVNGWSSVKNSEKYFDDAARVLRKMLLDEKAPHLSSMISPNLPLPIGVQLSERGLTRHGSGDFGTYEQSEELRCVIAVLRHGDRTPKQKIKLNVIDGNILSLLLKYNGGRPRFEAKLKSAVQLKDLLDAMRIILPSSDSKPEDRENAEKLKQVKTVLEKGGSFAGIYRKVQLKPLKWSYGREGEEEQPVEALMVLKYGGVLTHAGRNQAEELGRYFRNNMYPCEGTGLLRLHRTFRHDLKIYSSDEGRVQMSAAAFAKGLLNLEGQLTPILVSLVSKDSSMLDGLDNASTEIGEAKARLNDIIISGAKDDCGYESSDTPWMADGAGLPADAFELLRKLVQLTKEVTSQVRVLANDGSSAVIPCEDEGFILMHARWKKLETDIYNEFKERFDISKISDVYDSCKYDLLHNARLNLRGLVDLFRVSQSLANGVIPNEYGINPHQKLKIGSKITRCLLAKILIDLRNSRGEPESKNDKEATFRLDPNCADVNSPDRHIRTRLYFTSESHIHSLMNVIRYCHLDESDGLVCHSGLERLYKVKEMDYMSGIIFRMFENPEVPLEDPRRCRIEMTFTPGADSSILEKEGMIQDCTLPIMSPERLQEVGSYLTLDKTEKMLSPFVGAEVLRD